MSGKPIGVEKLDQFDFHHRLDDTSGPALVFFTGPHCGSCRQLRQALSQLATTYRGIRLFEVDAERDTALARAFNVFHLPSMFLFLDGHFHCPLHSQPLPAALGRAIERALARPPEEEP